MTRKKKDMEWRVFEKSIEVCKILRDKHGFNELNLCGIGESTLHPQFADFVLHARSVMGQSTTLVIATNGVGVTQSHADILSLANVRSYVSLHRPEKAAGTVNMFRGVGILSGVSGDPALASVDWAGQVAWPVTAKKSECSWLRNGWAFITADGDVSQCSFDGNGVGAKANVFDEDLLDFEIEPYELCKTCHMTY